MKVSFFFIPLTTLAFNSFPTIKSLWSDKKLLPMWLPIEMTKNVEKAIIKPIKILNENFAFYKDRDNNYRVVYDSCPHQGALFSSSKLTINNTIKCCYHGFEFLDGKFVKMPSSNYFNPKVCVPSLHVYNDSNFIYVLPYSNKYEETEINTIEPYLAPEELDNKFTKIIGKININQNCEIITENVLDMLHISFVHSFGNKMSPLPFNIRFHELTNTSGKTTFTYQSGSASISKQFAKQNTVTVENEYHLPSTTVTRVNAGGLIKTVVTRTLPVDENNSILFWEIHRNFWNGPLNYLGDYILDYMMKKTLLEDINVIKNIDWKKRTLAINTTYDKTIINYRKSKQKAFKHFLNKATDQNP